MKTKIVALIVATWSCLILSLPALAENMIEFNTWSKGPGELYQNKISETELQKMPSWAPEDGAPPLSVKQAVETARSYLKKKNSPFANAAISEVKLDQFIIPKYYKDKWCYIIMFMEVPVTCCTPGMMNVLVMMDGTVNEPVVVKY